MKIFSTFTGIGGFELGISNAWLETEPEAEYPIVVGYSEIDKFAISVYEKHFQGVKNYGDIKKIDANSLPDFDCLVGGFPCQSFSILGQRRALKTHAAHSSLTLQEFCKLNVLDFLYLKTSKGLSFTMADELSKPSSPRLMTWGMIANGRCLTAQITQYRTTETGLLLSEILEEQVDQKYYLSAEQQEKITTNVITPKRPPASH
jgi:hypothetical protein